LKKELAGLEFILSLVEGLQSFCEEQKACPTERMNSFIRAGFPSASLRKGRLESFDWAQLCRESLIVKKKKINECCIKDDSRPISIAVQARVVNRLSVLFKQLNGIERKEEKAVQNSQV